MRHLLRLNEADQQLASDLLLLGVPVLLADLAGRQAVGRRDILNNLKACISLYIGRQLQQGKKRM